MPSRCSTVTFDRTTCSLRDATTGTGAPHLRKIPRPPACAPMPARTKTDHCAASSVSVARSASAPSQLGCVSLSAVAVLLGDLVGVPGQPGQLPHRFIPGQGQIRLSALRPADTYQRQPGIRQRLPQLLTRRRRHTTHSTATHRTDTRNRPASPTSNIHPTVRCGPHADDLSLPGRAEFGRIATRRVDDTVRRRIGPARTNTRTRTRPFGRRSVHRRPPAVHRTTRERPVVWVTFKRSGKAADLPFPRTGTRRSRCTKQYGASQIATGNSDWCTVPP